MVEGEDYRRGPVAHTERTEDFPDVALHRHHRNDEFGGDLIIGQAAADQLQHGELPCGEPVKRGGAVAARRRARRPVGVQHTPGDRRIEDRLTGRHRPYRAD